MVPWKSLSLVGVCRTDIGAVAAKRLCFKALYTLKAFLTEMNRHVNCVALLAECWRCMLWRSLAVRWSWRSTSVIFWCRDEVTSTGITSSPPMQDEASGVKKKGTLSKTM